MSSLFNSKFNQTLFTLMLLGIVAALAAYTYVTLTKTRAGEALPTINVIGTGEVFAKPDVAQFSFTVKAEGADAATAIDKSATAINSIMAYLKENGIDEKDIKTEGYNLTPKYRFEERACTGVFCPPVNQVQDGFEVFQSVSVKVRDIAKSGALLSGVGEKGATDISGLAFTVDDENALKAQARDAAIVDAQAEADKLAKSLGVRLVKLFSYYEDTPATPFYGAPMMDAGMAVKSAAVSVPEIATGENKITSTVTLTFEIK